MKNLRRFFSYTSFLCLTHLCSLPVLNVGLYTAQAQVDFEWVPVNEGLEGDRVDILWQSPEGTFFAGGVGGLFRSPGLYERWQSTSLQGVAIGAISEGSTGQILVGTNEGLFVSEDDGITWYLTSMRLPILDIAIDSEGKIAVATPDGAYISSNLFNEWDILGQWSSSSDESSFLPVYTVAMLPGGVVLAGLGVRRA